MKKSLEKSEISLDLSKLSDRSDDILRYPRNRWPRDYSLSRSSSATRRSSSAYSASRRDHHLASILEDKKLGALPLVKSPANSPTGFCFTTIRAPTRLTKSAMSDLSSVPSCQQNTKQMIHSLYEIWIPQLSLNYRPFVHYVHPRSRSTSVSSEQSTGSRKSSERMKAVESVIELCNFNMSRRRSSVVSGVK
ncbi:uncharacterized protein LOC134270155 [Saccostrea cucullata]|uniref:uncharacterized protein LOC134270155 n=1 Tax=Saccostrea cuccullata TaxID=36930 RepID=UPI002ED12D73